MRICYFADGRSIHTQRWMEYFARVGHEMFLLSYAIMSYENIAAFQAMNVRVLGTIGNFHIKKFWLTLKDLRFIRSVLKQEKIDILHSHFLGANAWYGAFSGYPHIITIMGGGDVNGPNWKPDSNVQAKCLTPYSLRNAAHITSWSRMMADVVRPYCRPTTRIDVVHGGIHLDRFSPGAKPDYLLRRYGLRQDDRIIFSPRLIRPLSNIDQIAKAFGMVREYIPTAKLLFVSPASARDQDYEEAVQGIIKSYGGIGDVGFLGEIDHSEIAEHFRLADVTVSVTDIDGTPMTVLESMACGTPTVIGDLADYDREYFEHEKTTLMVNVKDPRSIADAILNYIMDTKLAEGISGEARKRVEETGSYEFQMEKMNAIYQSMMER